MSSPAKGDVITFRPLAASPDEPISASQRSLLRGPILAVVILVYVAVRIFGLTIQVRYLVRHGAAQTVSACLSAAVTAASVASFSDALSCSARTRTLMTGLPNP